MTALVQDIGRMNEKKQLDVAARLTAAARECGRSPVAMALDFLKLRRRRGKLKFYEYFLYGLYDTKRWTEAERDEFVSSERHWPMVNPCNNRNWWALTEDKWLSSCFLAQNDVPIPRTEAVFDRGQRHFGGTRKLQSAGDLKGFLSAYKSFPLFAKPIGGMWSVGAMRITGQSETHVFVDGKDPMTHADLADNLIGDQSYIFQECLKPHGFFDGITDAIATVRCLNLIKEDGLSVPCTLLKLPRQGNVADNFWRPGNLLCDIAPETGEVRGIVSVKDGRRCPLDALPDEDRPLIGEKLPYWNELRTLNEKVALLHAANHFGSTDIALTESGPVIVEVNNGCAFELMQIASGRGFLDAEMTAFFRAHGVEV